MQPLISSKCCSGAQKRDWDLENYLDPQTLHHSPPLCKQNEFKGTFKEISIKSDLANDPVVPASHHNDGTHHCNERRRRPGGAPPIDLTPHSPGAACLRRLPQRTATSWPNIYCCRWAGKVRFEPSPQPVPGPAGSRVNRPTDNRDAAQAG